MQEISNTIPIHQNCIFNNNTFGLMLISPEGNIVEANRKAASLLGINYEYQTENNLFQFPNLVETNVNVKPDINRVKNLIQSKKSFILRSSISLKLIKFNTLTTSHENNFYLLLLEDVTEYFNNQQKLNQAEVELNTIFEKIFELSPVLIALSQIEDGKLLAVNEAYCKTLGFTKDELIGKSTVELGIIQPEIRNQIRDLIKQVGSLKEYPITAQTKDRKPIEFLWFSDLVTINGESKLLTVCIDHTEKYNALKKLSSLNKEIKEEVKSKTLDLERSNKNLKEALFDKEKFILKSEEYNITLKNILSELKSQKDSQSSSLQQKYYENIVPLISRLKRSSDTSIAAIELLENRLNEMFQIEKSLTSIPYFKLTVAEAKVVKMIQKGYIAKQIADKMKINLCTVYKHQKNIRQKLGLTNEHTQLRSFLINNSLQ